MTLIRNSIVKALESSLYVYRMQSEYVGVQKEMFIKKYVNYLIIYWN